jgi:hypothetical protein
VISLAVMLITRNYGLSIAGGIIHEGKNLLISSCFEFACYFCLPTVMTRVTFVTMSFQEKKKVAHVILASHRGTDVPDLFG